MISRPSLRLTVLAAALATAASGCPVYEPAGLSRYFVVNESTHELAVLAFNIQDDSETDVEAVTLAAGDAAQIFEDGGFGVNPTPDTSFVSLRVQLAGEVDDVRTVYLQDPIEPEQWDGGRIDGDEARWGVSEWTLTLEDADLDLDGI
jgi:hypothetical protein